MIYLAEIGPSTGGNIAFDILGPESEQWAFHQALASLAFEAYGQEVLAEEELSDVIFWSNYDFIPSDIRNIVGRLFQKAETLREGRINKLKHAATLGHITVPQMFEEYGILEHFFSASLDGYYSEDLPAPGALVLTKEGYAATIDNLGRAHAHLVDDLTNWVLSSEAEAMRPTHVVRQFMLEPATENKPRRVLDDTEHYTYGVMKNRKFIPLITDLGEEKVTPANPLM